MKLTYSIKKEDLAKNIHEILKTKLEISTRLLNKLIKNKQITINQNICDTRCTPRQKDILEIDLSYPEDNTNIVAVKMRLRHYLRRQMVYGS